MCVGRFAQDLMAETAHAEIRVCVCGPFCPKTDTHKPKFAGFDGGVCVCLGGKSGHVLMAETPPGPMCV